MESSFKLTNYCNITNANIKFIDVFSKTCVQRYMNNFHFDEPFPYKNHMILCKTSKQLINY